MTFELIWGIQETAQGNALKFPCVVEEGREVWGERWRDEGECSTRGALSGVGY